MTRTLWTTMALAAPLLLSPPLIAAEQDTPNALDRCLKSINLIGASIGHKEQTGPDGKPMLHFLVRSNGSEYNVKCESATGMVKDVSAHFRGEVTAN